MAYNKVIKKDGTILLDLTNNTVVAETLGKGVTATDRSGNKITGTLTDSPLPIEVSTEEEMSALLTNGEVGSVYKYTGTTGTYENNALYEITEEPAKSFTKLILQSDLEEITITENGEYNGEYSKVTVNVESGGTTLTTKEKWQLICSWLSNAWLMLDSETTYQYMTVENIDITYQNASAIQTACANIYNRVNNYLTPDNIESYISLLNTLNNNIVGFSFSFNEPREGLTFQIASDANRGYYIILNISLNISSTIGSTTYGLVGFAKWSE